MPRGAIVDLDGTVYMGGTLVDGADDGVDALRAAGVTPLFFSTTRPATAMRSSIDSSKWVSTRARVKQRQRPT